MTIPNDYAASSDQQATCDQDAEKSDSPRNWTAAIQKTEDEGFIILDEMPAERLPEIPPSVPKPAPQRWRQYTDDQLSRTCRWGSKTHMWEPIYKDGKETGEWRVYESRGYNWCSFRPSREVPWDAVLPNEEAVHQWVKER